MDNEKTYNDYSPGRKKYVDHNDMNMAFGGEPLPHWSTLSDKVKEDWEERAKNDDGKGFFGT